MAYSKNLFFETIRNNSQQFQTMNYYAIEITTPQYTEEKIEILIALLGELPFDTFEETGDGLTAYISEEKLTQDVDNQLVELSVEFDFSFKKTFIPYQNWNQIWESNFQPIRVEDFVGLRADFHPPTEGVRFDLVINPKMAFGTGHHETTYMMMQMMRDVDFVGKKVLDYGCGTGILAILASKLGATTLEAVDIEQPSFENTIENCTINKVSNVVAIHGILSDVPSADFDVILANINRNVILDSLLDLKKRLCTEGSVLISGFLKQDESAMLAAVERAGFRHQATIQRGNWLCMKLATHIITQ